MGRFADSVIDDLAEAELDEFERLMDLPDQQVLGWITGAEPVPADRDGPLLRRLREFHAHSRGPAA
jgi:antitoxin CptB